MALLCNKNVLSLLSVYVTSLNVGDAFTVDVNVIYPRES